VLLLAVGGLAEGRTRHTASVDGAPPAIVPCTEITPLSPESHYEEPGNSPTILRLPGS